MQLNTLLLVAVVAALLSLPMSADMGADRSSLLTLRSAVAGRTLLWTIGEASPCEWAGAECDSGGRVKALRLPGASLIGVIPGGAFANLTSLQTLSLRLNHLAGPIPDFSACINLRSLYLQGNLFSGGIPPTLFTLHRLVRLNLASNDLTGALTDGFNNMTRLRTLLLQQNRLTGIFPATFKLPRLESFNISDNHLNGSIPESLQSFTTESFLGNSLCGKPLGPCPLEQPSVKDDGNGKKKLSGSAGAGIAVGSVFGFIFFTILVICLCRKIRDHKNTPKKKYVELA